MSIRPSLTADPAAPIGIEALPAGGPFNPVETAAHGRINSTICRVTRRLRGDNSHAVIDKWTERLGTRLETLFELADGSGGLGFRAMTPDDLDAAHALSAEMRWPHRLEDWRFLLALGKGIVAVRDDRVVATGITWNWGESQSTLGMVIVSTEMQGQRIGFHMMERLITQAGKRSITLHATAEGRGLYERLGFAVRGEVLQCQGIVASPPLIELAEGMRLRPMGRADIEPLVELDQHASGMDRSKALRILLIDEEAVVLTRDGRPVGFSIARRFGRGHAIGPVVAPDLPGAQALIAHWVGRYAQRFVRIDINRESGLLEWLVKLGLLQVGNVAVMSRGNAPSRAPHDGFYGLISQALG